LQVDERLIGAGLLVQLVTLLEVHPLAFVAFLGVGCPLVAAALTAVASFVRATLRC
jgi:hypothetical protein